MISVRTKISDSQIASLKKALGDASRRLGIELSAAVNATAKKVKSEAAKKIQTKLNVTQKILKKTIWSKGKATPQRPYATITLTDGYPIPLKYFKAKQTKRDGLTYKIDPKDGRRSIIRDGFLITRYGGNAYRRRTAARGPLEKLFGPAPGSVYKSAGVRAVIVKVAKVELRKQIDRRIRLVLLRAQGKVAKAKGIQ